MNKKYYIDSCIWLNLFKKEGDETKGKPYWQIAKEFLLFIFKSNNTIYYSGIILKEIQYVLEDDELFNERKKFFKQEENIISINITSNDYELARNIENETDFQISFYDYLHLAICINNNFILITRDKDFLKLANNYHIAHKPEKILT